MIFTSYEVLRYIKGRLIHKTEVSMALGQHSRTQAGTFRKERNDSLVKNLREEYPEFKNINGNTKLGTLEKELGVDSLSAVRRALREQNQ